MAHVQVFECNDFEKVNIGEHGVPLEIVKATYGGKNPNRDFTDKVKGLVEKEGNGFVLFCEGGIHLKLGDPEGGVPKKFKVQYKMDRARAAEMAAAEQKAAAEKLIDDFKGMLLSTGMKEASVQQIMAAGYDEREILKEIKDEELKQFGCGMGHIHKLRRELGKLG